MPIYEYTCRKCNAHVEALQKVTDKPLTRCQKCGGRLDKEWSQTSFQLKGSGWYVTDYAGKKADSKETKSESKTESPSSGTETKPVETKKKETVTPSKSGGD